jgi:hypothetical protein
LIHVTQRSRRRWTDLSYINDELAPVGIYAGFEVAPGDASDVEVTNAHAWGSSALIFSDGTRAYTAKTITRYKLSNGIAFFFRK